MLANIQITEKYVQSVRSYVMTRNQEILNLAVLAGEILLKNGGEIYRVEDTMIHIITAYGITDYNVYVLSNGIFATIDEKGEEPYSIVRHVSFGNTNLERIAAVNQLSREISEQKYTPSEAMKKMSECDTLAPRSLPVRCLACGLGCGAFAMLFGGNVLDSVFAFFIGIVLQLFLHYSYTRKPSQFFDSIAASALVTALSILVFAVHIPVHVDKIIIGCIMPLVPGLALTNSIRDFFNSDYLSGVIHMVNALLTALCIAVGVGSIMTFYQFLGGTLL